MAGSPTGPPTQISAAAPTALPAEDPNNCQPVACPANLAPVCSTNNNTYANDCVARACYAVPECLGECPCPTEGEGACPRGLLAHLPCSEQEQGAPATSGTPLAIKSFQLLKAFLRLPQCFPPLAAEDPNRCRIGVCPTNYLPVCSTKNNTYGNACAAEACYATIACEGECPCKAKAQRAGAGSAARTAHLAEHRPKRALHSEQGAGACSVSLCSAQLKNQQAAPRHCA